MMQHLRTKNDVDALIGEWQRLACANQGLLIASNNRVVEIKAERL